LADNSSSSSSSQSSSSSGEIESPFALLEAVEAAILRIVTGLQSYTLADRQAKEADLNQLRSLRKELLAEVAALQRTRPTVASCVMQGNM